MTPTQAVMMVEQLKMAKAGKMRFLDMVMPNGKKFADCTGDEVAKFGEDLMALAEAEKLP